MLTDNDKKQIEQFISMLYHDDHDSNYFICHFKNGRMNSFRTSLDEFDMSQINEIVYEQTGIKPVNVKYIQKS